MPNSSKNSMSSIIKKLIKENPKGKYSIQFTINNGELNGHLVSLNKNIKKGGSIEENTNQEELNQLSFSTPPKKSKSNMTKEFRKNYPEDKYDMIWYKRNNGELYPSPIRATRILNADLIAKIILIFNLILL